MNRQIYFNFIEEKLDFLAFRIECRGGLNILDLNLHSENFYLHLFNLLFDLNLTNLNIVCQNAAAIDLVDSNKKVVIQVSSTATKEKVESALKKDLSAFKGYSFKFISISKDASHLKDKTFTNPHSLKFLPAKDIYDVKTLLAVISAMGIDGFSNVYKLIRKELHQEVEPQNVESNLASIITILSQENWNHGPSSFPAAPFDIEKKITYNQLDRARTVINDYKVHHSRVDNIYREFDKQGANKSLSILDGIRSQYVTVAEAPPDERFFSIINSMCDKTRKSANYKPMPAEELELCIRILIVDAFIRCKIFKNPIGEIDAHT